MTPGGVFFLIFEPMEAITRLGKEMNCSDGMARHHFPVLAAWIANQAENEALHGMKRMGCTVCVVPLERLGSVVEECFPTQDYERYARIVQRYLDMGDEDFATSLLAVEVRMNRNIFAGIPRVRVPLLFKPDVLHNIYIGLFKHMMQWIEDFLKKHDRQAVFDEVWKSLPPYPGFSLPKMAYREVT